IKKLFQLTPLLKLFQYKTLKIIGPYHFLHTNASSCSFIYTNYHITIHKKSVKINTLKKKMLHLSIKNLQKLHIKIT
ncbi:hypothetical protein, partial [Lysinibacillus agricola]|uniref:hypothetical protein n=1 Tax=Lysinibacillus agricola TaxID=2590012 RepID=UPI003C232A88